MQSSLYNTLPTSQQKKVEILVSNDIRIPRLELSRIDGKLVAQLSEFLSQEQLKKLNLLNPKIWLFRWSRKNKYKARKSSVRYRHPEIKGVVTEFDQPKSCLEFKPINLIPEDWYKREDKGRKITVTRGPRRKIQITKESSERTVTINFGLALTIDNPSGSKPKRIYGEISKFKMRLTFNAESTLSKVEFITL